MKRLSRFLSRISTKGYLLIAGFIAIVGVATYSNWHSQQQLAAEQARQVAAEKAKTEAINTKQTTADPLPQESATEVTPEVAATPTAPQEDTSTPRPPETAKPGDLLTDNTGTASKKAKVYYGGPLVFSTSTITISSSLVRPAVTVSTADGTPINLPTTYWGGDNEAVTASIDPAKAKNIDGQQTSWPMVIDAYTQTPGTYKLELVSSTTQNDRTVIYAGSITVVVLP